MSPDMRWALRALRWPYALVFAVGACAVTRPPVDVDGAARETCAAECARREATGCLETALVSSCVPTCQRIRAAGLYAPERCRK